LENESRSVNQRGSNFKEATGTCDENDTDLLMAAMENSYKLKAKTAEQPAANFATPINPRLKELKRTETPMMSGGGGGSGGGATGSSANSPQSTTDNSNKFSTPVWLKPQDPNNPMKFNFDYELAMERLKTPVGDMNRSKLAAAMGKNETPLHEAFMNAIQIASLRNANGNFYFRYCFQLCGN
jgi:hypothetical protein